MTPDSSDLWKVFVSLYHHPKLNVNLRIFASKVKSSKGNITRNDVDPTSLRKLNAAIMLKPLSDFTLAEDFFLHPDFQNFCRTYLRGQNLVLVQAA